MKKNFKISVKKIFIFTRIIHDNCLAWAGDAKQCGIWTNLLSKPIIAASLATLLHCWDLGLPFVAQTSLFSLKTQIISCRGRVIWSESVFRGQ